jgi:ATP-binding cassette, subfamily B, bacterial
MIAEVWQTRTEPPLTFHYGADSYAESNLETIIADYRKALTVVCAFLGLDEGSLAPIEVHLSSFLSATSGQQAGEITHRAPERGEIWTMVNSESPGANPTAELAQLLLHRTYGPQTPENRFWYDGLAGYLAGKDGESSYDAEAPQRVQKLFDSGQLPPIIDLLSHYGIRQSTLGSSTATAFVGFLIAARGPEPYKRVLAALKNGDPPAAFRRIYSSPLQSLEQAWYRTLEATGAAASTGLLDAVKQMVPYLKTYRLQLLWILGAILVTISFTIFMPMAIRFLVNNILTRRPLLFPVPGIGDTNHQLAIGDEQTHALLVLLGYMIFMFVLSALSNTRRAYLITTMGEGINHDLRMRFFDIMQRVPVAYHRRTPNQDLSSRFWTDTSTIAQSLTFGLVPMAHSALAMLLFGVVLVSLNWKLAIIALAGLPIFAISFQRMRAKTRDAARERARRQTDVSQSLIETLNAHEKVRLQGLHGYLGQRFAERLQLLRELIVRITLLNSTSTSTSALITNGAQVAVLIVGGHIVIDSQNRELNAGDLMAFYVLLLQLYAPAGLFTSAMQFVNQATTSLDRVKQVLNEKPEQDLPNAVEVGPLREAIRFEGVTYGRARGKDLISDLTLSIPVGKKVAFVGPPASGKANLMELLPRFFTVARGQITWDGVDINQVQAASLRRNLAVVAQETYSFYATVYDNIRYGRPDASDEEVIRAAHQAGLHDFILGLPGGYDTQINDRDASFGLVQRQRLAVARALLQDASVILMDDALSALDAPSQRELEQALRGMPTEGTNGRAEQDQPKTLIRIAQRLNSATDADLIYVMDDGELKEQGTDEELRFAGGLYAQLLKDELGAGAVSGAFQAVRRLARQAPFSSLPSEVLEEVARLMLYAERSPGDVICRQGSVGDELFVLGRGEVEIVLEEDESNERILNFLHEGEYFGEISFLRRVPRTATVRARTQVELHILRRQDFDQMLENLPPDVAAHLDRTAQERIDMTRERLAITEATPVG